MSDLVRICPLCGKHNPPEETFCVCGTMLADVDFTHLGTRAQPVATVGTPVPEPAPAIVTCPHADCGQPNPPGSERCVYCNRPLTQSAAPEAISPLPPTLRERFRAIETMPTEGGQADLVLAETMQRERRVVKLYRKGIQPDRQVLERLPEGANLIHLFEHGMADGIAYEVMEYCAQGSLRKLLDGEPQSPEMLRSLIEQLSATLSALHREHILHRDLKPENVLLRSVEPLETALTDFGASSLKMATQYFTGGARTAHYAAPEVLTGVLDEKSDWWSLGMILLEAVTGRHPYADLSEQVALHQLATQSVDVSGVFDERLRMLCRGLLLRNPKKRWGEAEAARWLAGDESLAMPQDDGEGAAVKPYTLGKSQCVTRIDLALALARYWDDGRKDLMRGVVMNWVEQDLRDFNLARDIADAMMRRDLSDDARLLHVIVSALPDIPPIWKGKIITQEALARAAMQSVDGNEDAWGWLASIYKDDVLSILAGRGNADMARMAAEWTRGIESYRALWQRAKEMEEEWRRRPRAHRGEVADVDYMLYLAPVRMNLPAMSRVLCDMVLALHAPTFSAAAKRTVQNACAGVAESCSWYTRFVAEAQDGSDLFWSVAQRLLPFALEDAEKEGERQTQVVRNSDQHAMGVIISLEDACKRLLDFELIDMLDALHTTQLRQDVSDWIVLGARVKGLDHDNAALHEIAAMMDPLTMRAMDVRAHLDGHQHLLEVNDIWLRRERLLLLIVILLMLAAYSAALAGLIALPLAGATYWHWRRSSLSETEGLRRLRRMLDSAHEFADGMSRIRKAM